MTTCQHCGQELPQPTTAGFDDFWKVWPNRVSRKKAAAKWKSRKLDNMAERIIADVRNRLENDPRWVSGYIPDPCTYLNGDRWEDVIDEKPRAVRWPTDDKGWLDLGTKHDVKTKPGEGYPDYKRRVMEAARQ